MTSPRGGGMARRTKNNKGNKQIEALLHDEATHRNIPTAEFASVGDRYDEPETRNVYDLSQCGPRRDGGADGAWSRTHCRRRHGGACAPPPERARGLKRSICRTSKSSSASSRSSTRSARGSPRCRATSIGSAAAIKGMTTRCGWGGEGESMKGASSFADRTIRESAF
jgi:hypothetical protein